MSASYSVLLSSVAEAVPSDAEQACVIHASSALPCSPARETVLFEFVV